MRKIFDAYKIVGHLSTFFDRMMTSADLPARLALKFLWGLDKEAYEKFLAQAFAGIPKDFSGRLLEVPVGTGVLSLPIYKNLNGAEVFCLDYSDKMLNTARKRAAQMNLRGVKFFQGDVADLPFEDNYFDLLLSVNGFHAFPDKAAAWAETRRVLKFGGTFCGCMYVNGANPRTDLFVKKFCEWQGFFVPPYETFSSLNRRLSTLYSLAEVTRVESFAGFICTK